MDTPVHGRLRIGGRLFNDTTWSIGLAVSTPTGTDPFGAVTVDTEAEIEAWCDRVRALNGNAIFQDDLRGIMSVQSTVDYVRTARVNEQGRETFVAQVTLTTPAAGSGTAIAGAQTALVGSLLSGRPGAANRGRLYWPALAVPVQSSGRVNPTLVASTAAATASWISAAAGALAPGLNQQVPNVPAVVSRSTGRLVRITTVRVGNRLDSQRRRAEGQEEAYASSAVPEGY